MDAFATDYFEYAAYFSRRQDPPQDLRDRAWVVWDMAMDEPERFWRVFIELVDRAPDEAMECISTLLVERFISFHAERFVDRIKIRSTQSKRFHEAMLGAANWDSTPRGVWKKMKPILRSSWEELQSQDGERM